MLNTRHEEYTNTRGDAPLVLFEGITRTPSVFSEKQNFHENVELELCTDGEGVVMIDGKQHPFQRGDIAIIDSDAIHYTFSERSLTYSCIIVSTEFCERMGIGIHSLAFTPIVRSESMRTIFCEICREYASDDPLRIARLHQLLLTLLIEAVSEHCTKKERMGSEKRELTTVKTVLLFIRENYRKKLSLTEIAKHVTTDKYTLCKIFREHTGQSVFEALNAYRCLEAAQHLRDGTSVSLTAELCGFRSTSFFTKTFKRFMGDTPSAYLKNKRL